MTATYDPTLPAALDWMRLQLGDTTVSPESSALLSDEEYLAALNVQGGKVEATIFLAESLATVHGRKPKTVALPDGSSYSWGDRVSAWENLAKSLRASLQAAAETAAQANRAHSTSVGRMTTTAPTTPPYGGLDANHPVYGGNPYYGRRGY